MNHPVLFIPGLGGSPEHFGMDKAEPTCSDPVWTGTSYRIDRRPIAIKDKKGADVVIGHVFWLVVDIEAECNGGIRVPYHAESRVGASSVSGKAFLYPLSFERDGAVIRAGSVRFDVDEIVSGFKGKYIRDIAPGAEIERWRNFLRATDRVESFRDRSAPKLLATHFALDTSFDQEEFGPRDGWGYDPSTRKFTRAGKGINNNGLYVFQPKTWQTASQVCQEPESFLVGYEGGTVRVASSFLPIAPAMRLDFTLKCHGQWYPNSRRSIVVKFGNTPSQKASEANSTESASFVGGVLDCFVEYLSDYTFQLRIGSRSGTYRYRDAVAGLSYPLEPMYLPSEDVLPNWTGKGMDGGQADQLLVKMKDVLDEFYGVGLWMNNPDAQIDIVAHSQGGLVIREMIANNSQAAPDNPVSHIRQILAISSPLHGTALATDNTVLRSPASALDADLGQKPYPALAAMRDGLELKTVKTLFGEKTVPGYDCSGSGASVPTGCLDIKTALAVHVKESVSGFPMIGLPKTSKANATMSLAGPWLGPYSLEVLGEFKIQGIDLPYRQKLAEFSKKTSYLGWPQSSEFINSLVRSQEKKDAPRYPGSEEYIPFTTLSSGSVGSFVRDAVWGVSEALRGACPNGDKLWQAEASPKGITLARGWVTCASFRNAVSQVQSQLATQLSPIDVDWSRQSDLFVDLGSQRGTRTIVQSWNPSVNAGFKARTFAYNTYVLHGPFDINESFDLSGSGVRLKPITLNASFAGASMQGCDILDQLGVTGYNTSACLESEKTGFRNAVRTNSLFQLKPSFLVSGGGSSSLGKLMGRVLNPSSEALSGFELDVPVHADIKAKPVARLAGVTGASVAMVPVAKGAWIARINVPTTLEPSSIWPNENGFLLEITDPNDQPVRIAVDDSSDDWTGSVQAVVRSAQGTVLSGIDPVPALRIYSEYVATSLGVDVVVEAYQSRENDLAWTKPVLLLGNESDRKLQDFDVFYRVQAREDGAKPVIALWNVPCGVASGSAEVVADGDSGWLAVIHLRGASFTPGQELQDLKFGLHWPDFAEWDASRDPSDPGTGSLDLSLAVVDVDAAKAMNSLPEEPIGATTWRVEGFDEGLGDPRFIKPRLRLTNLGSTAVDGFVLRVPFTAPAEVVPILETWYVPGCTGALEGTGVVRAVVYSCPDAKVPAGGVWPDASGIAFGLHDAAWKSWSRGEDALMRELDGSWKVLSTPEVVR